MCHVLAKEPVFQEEIHELDLVRVARVLLAVAEVALLQDIPSCGLRETPCLPTSMTIL
jgi:hypothetical protein